MGHFRMSFQSIERTPVSPALIAFISLAGLIISISTVRAADDSNWGCYDPKPGHPTASERSAFVSRLRPVARSLQTEFGVPQGGLLAMAVQESGFGWTRTAINANNLFGWKFGQSAREANLGSWTLACQPADDPGKVYAVFPTWEDSIRFVAGQLARASRYTSATAAARAAIVEGGSDEAVAEAWLKGIQQAGYNPNSAYPSEVMNSGRKAGVFAKSQEASAGQATAAAASVQGAPVPSEADVEKVLGWFKRDASGRYWIAGADCAPLKSSGWPGYESLPDGAIRACQYAVVSCASLKGANRASCEHSRTVVGPKTATVVVLEPTADRMARWIATACAEAGGNRDRCLQAVYSSGVEMSGWQIPIAGLGYEDMETSHYVQVAYAFRDGLTVRADSVCAWKNGYPGGEAPPSPEQNAACSKPGVRPAAVSFQARPARTTRGDLVAYDKKYNEMIPPHRAAFPIPDAAADQWRGVVREALVAAYASDRNILVSAKAVSLRKSKAF